jgi:hypothetical protein
MEADIFTARGLGAADPRITVLADTLAVIPVAFSTSCTIHRAASEFT